MEKDVNKTFSKKYFHPFGKFAVDKGCVTAEQLKEALTEQLEDNLAEKPHRPIGQILLDNGWITKEQIGIVLKKWVELLKEDY